ncbi:outer membrane protein assembly factor [Desulfoprunum benzoelyticum]|uniref:Translocation and assembly module subunit TamA n=1 Tax=Desulfoprunum benzoelyticum TaxID=1506996 RepID=A0A840V630_9BACT|nr:autotransporter assembly complex family protein [Desulfoprunum benzoelyticum]MBB5348491.1 translocation and assembly module TamA [Desulfoprunum benzoelyticum]MBM9530174.1 outer membrane protein assembly factor [Desulfoprunum benzoelyticum]
MSCRILFFLLALFFLLPSPLVAAVTVDVQVKGVKGAMYDNILSRLKIFLHKDSRRLTGFEITRLHRHAKADIEEALAPFGYYAPIIVGTLDQEGDTWRAVYTVNRGEPVRVKAVRIEVEGPGGDDLAWTAREFPLEIGDVLDQSLYEKGKKQMVRSALRLGFLTARFSRLELRINRQAKTGEVDLVLDTGPRFLFGITTSEQKIIKPGLLARYLPYKVGDPWAPARLFELQRILYATDFFNRVSVRGDIDAARDLQIPVTVELETPQHLNRYSFGLGYATDTGARTQLEWRNRLLNTSGHKARGALQIAELENKFTLRYDIPRHDPRYDSYVVGATYNDQSWEQTQTRLVAAGLTLDHGEPRIRYGVSIEGRNEKYDVGATSGTSKLLMPGANLAIIWADSLVNTKNGLQLAVNLNGATEATSSDATFLQVTGSSKLIFSPFRPWRLIGRGTLGATLVDSIDDLPPSLRFYAGGDQSIRGFDYKELGTRDASGTVVGGRYLVVGSAELERIIDESWSLAAFFDVGNAMDDPKVDFEQGAGLGLRYRLPFGQVRFDLATALSDDNNPVRLHLSVGGDL